MIKRIAITVTVALGALLGSPAVAMAKDTSWGA